MLSHYIFLFILFFNLFMPMTYVYSKTKLSNTSDGSVIGKFIDNTNTIITYSNTYISVYHQDRLIYKEDLYEEIIAIEKYEDNKDNENNKEYEDNINNDINKTKKYKNNLIILFKECKISQFEVSLSGLKLICIRNLEKYEYDYYFPTIICNNNICLLKINYSSCIFFNPNKKDIEFYTFNNIIFNKEQDDKD
ncbi:hypothetical protein SLOPH_548, partial [Spraguea lophii 42_110]